MANDPVLIAYAVKRRRDGKGVNYERIGHAYPHSHGEGLTVVFDAMPVKGDHISQRRLHRRNVARAE